MFLLYDLICILTSILGGWGACVNTRGGTRVLLLLLAASSLLMRINRCAAPRPSRLLYWFDCATALVCAVALGAFGIAGGALQKAVVTSLPFFCVSFCNVDGVSEIAHMITHALLVSVVLSMSP